MTRNAWRYELPILLLAAASLGACQRTATKPPDERVDAPEVDDDHEGGDGVTDDGENPGARMEENAGTVEDDA